jgi:Xaa-Pro aminopeptidase
MHNNSQPVTQEKMWKVSRAEMERRWKLVGSRLNERNIDALVVQGYEDKIGGYVKWLTDVPSGYPRTIIFHANDLMTVIEHGPHQQRRKLGDKDANHPGIGESITNWSFQNFEYCKNLNADDVIAEIKMRGYKRIAVANVGTMPFGYASRIHQAFEDTIEIIDESDFIDCAKAMKSDEELSLIERTAALQDAVFSKVIEFIKPGMRDFEINAFIDYNLQLGGAERGVYIAKSAPIGKPAPFAYRHFQGRSIAKDDYINLLLESNGLGGYWTEMGRPVCFGKATAEMREGFALSVEAQTETAKLCAPGASPAEIFRTFNRFMMSHGAAPERRLHAHGQGHDTVERPLIRDDETMVISKGCNLAIHPVVATSTLWISVCDNYVVNNQGQGRFIHTTEKKIFEL